MAETIELTACGLCARIISTLFWMSVFSTSISALSISNVLLTAAIHLNSGTLVYHILNIILHFYLVVKSVVGCISNCRSNPLLYKWLLYSTLGVIVVTVLHLSYGIAQLSTGHFLEPLENELDDKVKLYYSNPEAKRIIDMVHQSYLCCGNRGSVDFAQVPESCADFKIGCARSISRLEVTARILEFGVGFDLVVLLIIFLCTRRKRNPNSISQMEESRKVGGGPEERSAKS